MSFNLYKQESVYTSSTDAWLEEETRRSAVGEEEGREEEGPFGSEFLVDPALLPCDAKGIGLTGGSGGVYPIHHSKPLSLLAIDLCSQHK